MFTDIDNLEIDLLGISEHNLAINHHTNKQLQQAAKHHYKHQKIAMMSTPSPSQTNYQPGGTGIFTHGSMVGRVSRTEHDKWGRWTTFTINIKNHQQLSIISVYQSPKSPKSSDNTYHNQQQTLIDLSTPAGQKAPTPRKQFHRDLLKYVKEKIQKNHHIIIGGDFNEHDQQSGTTIQALQNECSLERLTPNDEQFQPSSTHSRGQHIIDHVFCTKQTKRAVTRMQYTEFFAVSNSDHRTILIDININKLFPSIQDRQHSSFCDISSKDVRQVTQFISHFYCHCLSHNAFVRMARLAQKETFDKDELEKLDKLFGEAGKLAESKVRRKPRPWWSLKLSQHRRRLRALNKQIHMLRKHQDWSFTLEEQLEQAGVSEYQIPSDLSECYEQRLEVKENLRNLIAKSKQQREEEQINQIYRYQLTGDYDKARVLRIIHNAEKSSEAYNLMKRARKQHQPPPLTTLDIPKSWRQTKIDELNLDELEDPKTTTEWVTITAPREIEDYLLLRNRLHFHQAQGTPITEPPLRNMINWLASSESVENILNGGPLPQTLPEITRTILKYCQYQTEVIIPSTITVEQVKQRFKHWRESTTTSPSGRHLGWYKALVHPLLHEPPLARLRLQNEQDQLLGLLTNILNYAIEHNYSLERWQTIVTTMIPKDMGATKIHRIRVINLYEADYNLVLAIKWRELMHQMNQELTQHPDQHGSRPGHDATTLPFLEELLYDIARLSRTSIINFDNDAASCYDHIVPGFAGLVSRSHGQSKNIVVFNMQVLQQAKYHLKLNNIVTELFYKNEPEFPLYGTGQGSANSPALWGMVSSTLFKTHNEFAYGVTLATPTRKYELKTSMAGFVDDSAGRVNDLLHRPVKTLRQLINEMQHDAQLWARLLWWSGGKLEINKCSFHILQHSFDKEGFATTKPIIHVPQLTLEDPSSNAFMNIKVKSTFETHKTLGHHKAPAGIAQTQREIRCEKVMQIAKAIHNNPFDHYQAWRLYKSVYIPSISYTLPQSATKVAELQKDQKASINMIIAKCGWPRTAARAMIYGPVDFGGAGFLPWDSIQGAGQIKVFMKLWRTNTKSSSALRIAIAWMQHHCGISSPVLETFQKLEYVPHCWLQSLREFLKHANLSLEVDEAFTYRKQREHDYHLMDKALETGIYNKKQLEMINNCRLYLNVTTISDLSDIQGMSLEASARNGRYDLLPSRPRWLNIIQRKPGRKSWRLWNQLLRTFANRSGELYCPLGKWTMTGDQLDRIWGTYYDYADDCIYTHLEGKLWKRYSSTTTTLYTFQQSVPWIPKETSYPVFARQRNLLELVLGHVQSPPIIIPPTMNFQVFLHQKPQEAIELCINHQFMQTFTDIEELITSSDSLYLVTDGCVHEPTMCFGWICSTSTGTILMSGAGPAYGTPSSHRAEGYGMYAGLYFLTTVCQFLSCYPKKIQCACDNQGLITRLNNRDKYQFLFPNLTLAPDWDLVEAGISIIRSTSQTKFEFEHVKGHQDDLLPTHQLSLPAKLNITADRKANSYMETYHPMFTRVPMLPHTRVQLQTANGTITSHYAQNIHHQLGKQRLQEYVIERCMLPKDHLHDICWRLYSANLRYHKSTVLWNTKYLFDHLPTENTRGKYDITINRSCPYCNAPKGKWSHYLQCPLVPWQTDKMLVLQQLRKCLEKQHTAPDIGFTIYYCLHQMFVGAPIDQLMIPFHLKSTVLQQSRIGWLSFVKGLWHRDWSKLQQDYYVVNQLSSHTMTGFSWSRQIMKNVWQSMHALWLTYTTLLHNSTKGNPSIVHKQLQEKIIQLQQTYRNFCSHLDQRYLLTDDAIQTQSYTRLNTWYHVQAPVLQREIIIARKQQTKHQRTIYHFYRRPPARD